MKTNKLHEYNLNHEDSLRQIEEILEQNKPHYISTRIRCVAFRNKENWCNGICLIKIFSKDNMVKKGKSFYYDNIYLLEQWIKPENLLTFLSGFNNGKIKIANKKIIIGKETHFHEMRYLHRNSEYSSLPGHLYSTSTSTSVSCSVSNQVLLSHKFPFFANVYEAIKEWAELYSFHEGADARLRTISLFLPECRAYFAKLRVEPQKNALSINVRKNEPSVKLYAQGRYLSRSQYTSFNESISTDIGIIELALDDDDNIEELEVYLIDENDCLLDYHQENRFAVKGLHRVLGVTFEPPSVDLIKEALSAGENEQIEFKPYIKKGDSKIKEILETVIAFANTKGGYIFMGINDYACVGGIAKEVLKNAGDPSKGFNHIVQEYIGYIRKEISDNLNKNLQIKIEHHEHTGKQVLIINVPEGNAKPYANIRTRDIFIRKGANNVKPDPNTELPKLFRIDYEDWLRYQTII